MTYATLMLSDRCRALKWLSGNVTTWGIKGGKEICWVTVFKGTDKSRKTMLEYEKNGYLAFNVFKQNPDSMSAEFDSLSPLFSIYKQKGLLLQVFLFSFSFLVVKSSTHLFSVESFLAHEPWAQTGRHWSSLALPTDHESLHFRTVQVWLYLLNAGGRKKSSK